MDTSFIINVEQITEARQRYERPLTQTFLDDTLAQAPQWAARGDAVLEAFLTKVNARNVVLEGNTDVVLRSPCRRCLVDVETHFPISFSITLVHRAPDSSSARGKARQEPEDDGEGTFSASFDVNTDEEDFNGETIDLAPLAREQVLLSLPSVEPLCKEGCLGLCAECGQNLNDGACNHDTKPLDPRWSGLKNIKLTH